MEIRPAKPQDVQQVLPLIQIVFDEMEMASLATVSPTKLHDLLTDAFLMPDYRYSYRRTWVATMADEVVGIAVGYPHADEAMIDDALKPLLPKVGLPANTRFFTDPETWSGEWYLDTLAVAENRQGHGIGTALLKGLPQRAQAAGAGIVSLNVDFTNKNAQHLYKKMGYQKVGELPIGTHQYAHLQLKL